MEYIESRTPLQMRWVPTPNEQQGTRLESRWTATTADTSATRASGNARYSDPRKQLRTNS
jgi:hypothetical protein